MSKRRKNDAYHTPPESGYVDILLKLRPDISGMVFEPCAGQGNLVKALEKKFVVSTNDIDGNFLCDTYLDAKSQYAYLSNPSDWIISNIPFNQALEIIQEATKHAHCAFLVRLSFLEPTHKRGKWLSENPPTDIIVLPRVSFTGDGKTDSVTCCWLIWEKNKSGCIKVSAKE